MSNSNAVIGVVMIVSALVIVGVFVLLPLIPNNGGNGGGIFEPKPKVVCDVGIKNPLIGDGEITGADCRIVDECVFTFQAVAGESFGFSDMRLTLNMGGVETSKFFSIFEEDTEHVTLTVCSESSTGTLQLVDENGVNLDSRSVAV